MFVNKAPEGGKLYGINRGVVCLNAKTEWKNSSDRNFWKKRLCVVGLIRMLKKQKCTFSRTLCPLRFQSVGQVA